MLLESNLYEYAHLIAKIITSLKPLPEAARENNALFNKLYKLEEKEYIEEAKRYNREVNQCEIDEQKRADMFVLELYERLSVLKHLPKELSDKIADLRVFAIGYATQEVIDLANPYRDRLKQRIRETTNKLNEVEKQIKNSIKLDYN